MNLKKFLSRGLSVVVLVAAMLILLGGCGQNTDTVEKALYIVNETDVTVTSLTLDVEGKPLGQPIEVLTDPLEAGGIQDVVVNLPAKQAQKKDWVAFATTEEGAENSHPFTVGSMNPDEENPSQGLYVFLVERDSGNYYSVGVSSVSAQEYLEQQNEEDWSDDGDSEDTP